MPRGRHSSVAAGACAANDASLSLAERLGLLLGEHRHCSRWACSETMPKVVHDYPQPRMGGRALAQRAPDEPSPVGCDGFIHRVLSALLGELLDTPGATLPNIPAPVLRIHVADTRPGVAYTRCRYPPRCCVYTLQIPAPVLRIHVADTRPGVAYTRCRYPPRCCVYTLQIPAPRVVLRIPAPRWCCVYPPRCCVTRCRYPSVCCVYPPPVVLRVPAPGGARPRLRAAPRSRQAWRLSVFVAPEVCVEDLFESGDDGQRAP